MKRTAITLLLIAFVSTVVVSCKGKESEAATTEEKDVVEATDGAADYAVDIAASQIQWKGSKPLGSHTGTINLSSGSISMKDNAIEAGKFTINMSTITNTDLEAGNGKENLEAHLKGTVEGKEGDFFDINKYPTATFEVTGMEEKDGATVLNGNLTMKDTTHNVSFPITITPDEDRIRLESAPFVIDRTQWGINYGSKSVFDNLGDNFISDDMEITVSIVARKY